MARELALLVALEKPGAPCDESLDELERLAESAGAEVAGRIVQRRATPDPASLIGRGKVQELAEIAAGTGAGLVIFDEELSPGQRRNIEALCPARVIDRTELILDLFAQRARSREGRFQVELAQLRYLLPQLVGRGRDLSRLGGGIGTRGPGETKLETDRRRIRTRIAQIEKEIEALRVHRSLARRSRRRGALAAVSLVGYTNAGKTTLLNALTGAAARAEDRLFATLDPTSRRITLMSPGRGAGEPVIVTDTVGFIRHLPHTLVAAFRATLEEVVEADALIHVVDAAHPRWPDQMEAVTAVLEEIGAGDKPTLFGLNKIDLLAGGAGEPSVAAFLRQHEHAAAVSASTGEGLPRLLAALGELLAGRRERVTVLLPHRRGDLVAAAHERGRVLAEEYRPDGILLTAEVERSWAGRLREAAGEAAAAGGRDAPVTGLRAP